jgi:hypothetical protein
MNKLDAKYAAAKRECALHVGRSPTPGIPGLALKPGTGTTLKTPVPANLMTPSLDPKNPIGLTAEQVAFLCLLIFPARLNRWQTATLLGFTESNISALIKIGFLSPLNQADGTDIYFAQSYVMSVRENTELLFEMTNALIEQTAAKNRRSRERKLGAMG